MRPANLCIALLARWKKSIIFAPESEREAILKMHFRVLFCCSAKISININIWVWTSYRKAMTIRRKKSMPKFTTPKHIANRIKTWHSGNIWQLIKFVKLLFDVAVVSFFCCYFVAHFIQATNQQQIILWGKTRNPSDCGHGKSLEATGRYISTSTATGKESMSTWDFIWFQRRLGRTKRKTSRPCSWRRQYAPSASWNSRTEGSGFILPFQMQTISPTRKESSSERNPLERQHRITVTCRCCCIFGNTTRNPDSRFGKSRSHG